jgi:hypothetical protein
MSQTLSALRAELIRHQADCLALDQQLNAATPGTPEYGKLRDERQRLGLAITTTRKLLSTASKGRQSSLL